MTSQELADAQAWYDRAQEHFEEFRRLNEFHDQWQTRRTTSPDGKPGLVITFDRQKVTRLKPVACEAANAIFQCLDNIVAAGARKSSALRSPQIAWPWKLSTDGKLPDIETNLKVMSKKGVDDVWLNLIRHTFDDHRSGLIHIDVLKEVSLSGKHWELVPTSTGMAAIAWPSKEDGKQEIVEIPAGHFEANDEFIIELDTEFDAPRLQILIGMKLIAPGKDHQPEPMSAFGYASRFAETALAKARQIINSEKTSSPSKGS